MCKNIKSFLIFIKKQTPKVNTRLSFNTSGWHQPSGATNNSREIAVEYAKNQPKTVTYNNIYWR